MQKTVVEITLLILNDIFVRKNATVEMKHILLKFVLLTQEIPMKCVTEPNIFAF